MQTRWILAMAGALVLAASGTSLLGGPADCAIVDGTGIGGVRLGMTARAALAITGAPLREQAVGSRVTYALRDPWAQMIADYGFVERIATRSAACRTARGVGPGSPGAAVRTAYADAAASITTTLPEGDLLSYPFAGVAFLLRRDRVESVEVFRAEVGLRATPAAPRQAAPGAPSPTRTAAPGGWSVRASSARVEDTTLVVTGTVENRGRPMVVYAEVRAFDEAGRRVAEGSAPLYPNPVPSGGTSGFEVRLQVTDVVRRYTVTIRPTGQITGALAEHAGEIKGLAQFAQIIGKQLEASVQWVGGTQGFVVVVSNRSSVAVAGARVVVQIEGTCRLALPAPRFVQDSRTGSAAVGAIPPGGSARAAVDLSPGICQEFTSWSATTRIADVRVTD
ncbi:MAG: hypothetical protein FJX73_02745 [Armatimonadetes bacterium]|nr:hypothetical protein [Armatimonadota bacterium]